MAHDEREPETTRTSSTQPAQTPPKQPKSPWHVGGNALAVGAGLLVLGCLAAYLGGRVPAQSEAAALEADLRARMDELHQEVKDAEDRATAAEQRIAALEARRQVCRALQSLDQRNFGIAQERVTAAARAAKEADLEATLVETLSTLEIVVAEDFQQQRQQVQALGEDLDTALARPGAP